MCTAICNQANSAPPGKGKGKDRAVTKALKKDAKGGERRISFFESLPNDSFSPPEIKLRTAVFEFLARWQLKKKATLADLCRGNCFTCTGFSEEAAFEWVH